jgi:predicted nucleic acid-binding protein
MNSVFILNASPIILLGKAGLLCTISPLADLWIVPDGVTSEIESKRPIAQYLDELGSAAKVTKESVQFIHPLIASWDLGKGESEVLSLAMQKGANVKVILDDLQARKCAKLLDIELIGSLGLLIRAKQVGLVKAVKPEINKLIDVGIRIDRRLLAEIYSKIKE